MRYLISGVPYINFTIVEKKYGGEDLNNDLPINTIFCLELSLTKSFNRLGEIRSAGNTIILCVGILSSPLTPEMALIRISGPCTYALLMHLVWFP